MVVVSAPKCTCLIHQPKHSDLGFFTPECVASMATCETHRTHGVLVRMGGCRFVAPVQDVDKILKAVLAAHPEEYVRDYSAPAAGAGRG